MSPSNTAGEAVKWIGCPRWRPTWSVVGRPSSYRRVARQGHSLPKPRPQLYPSSFLSVRTLLGLVSSPVSPGPAVTWTGVNFFTVEVAAKRLELLRELVPAVTRVAALVDSNAGNAEATAREVEIAARSMGLQIQVLNTSTSREIDAAFASFVRERPDALFVGSGPFFIDRRVQLALLAAHHSVPATYQDRLNAEAGGLMSYGASLTDAYRQVGAYAGRILKGTKPADLPIVQSTKIELVINVQAARVLGITVPPTLLARADEVIE